MFSNLPGVFPILLSRPDTMLPGGRLSAELSPCRARWVRVSSAASGEMTKAGIRGNARLSFRAPFVLGAGSQGSCRERPLSALGML